MFMKRIAELIMMAAAQPKPVGQIEWTTPGTYYWTVPDNCYSISALTQGAGGGSGAGGNTTLNGRGGSGGGLRYLVTAAVTPGEVLTIIVGAPGAGNTGTNVAATVGGDSRIHRNGVDLVWAQGGQLTAGGTGSTIGGQIGGGNGGAGGASGTTSTNGGASGGGAGGYAGNGGAGITATSTSGGNPGTGGAGGSGGTTISGTRGGHGGGVGLQGQGANGTGGAYNPSSTGGDGGAGSNGVGMLYGAGAGGRRLNTDLPGTAGGNGAVRIIYGEGRFYPSTRTADE